MSHKQHLQSNIIASLQWLNLFIKKKTKETQFCSSARTGDKKNREVDTDTSPEPGFRSFCSLEGSPHQYKRRGQEGSEENQAQIETREGMVKEKTREKRDRETEAILSVIAPSCQDRLPSTGYN